MKSFWRYTFTPGYVIVSVNLLVFALLFSTGFAVCGKWLVVACIGSIWLFGFAASLLVHLFYYTRYRRFNNHYESHQ
jgi:hypothetical protein